MPSTKSGRATGTLTPADIPRPNVGRDPGVAARPATVLIPEIRDPRGQALAAEAGAIGSGVGAQARALDSFSNDLSRVGETFRQIYKARQEAEDRVSIDHGQLRLNQDFEEVVNQKLNSPDTGNPDFPERLDEELKARQESVVAEMKEKGFSFSPDGMQRFQSEAMRLRIGAARRAAVGANNQRVSLLNLRADENVNAIARSAGESGDVDGAIERVNSTVETMRPVLAPDRFKAYVDRSRNLVYETAIDGHIRRGRVDQAQAIVDRVTGFAKPDIGEVGAAIVEESRKRGVDPAIGLAIANVESGLDPTKTNPKSSARGVFQFTRDTARVFGLPEDAGTWTPEMQAASGAALIADNIAALKRGLGADPTPTDVYLAHFLGAPTAVRALRADPGAKIGDVMSPDQIAANAEIRQNGKALPDWNIGELYTWAQQKMRGGMAEANRLIGGRTVTADEAGVPIKSAMVLGHKVHNAATAERSRMRVLFNDDIASIRQTGQPLAINEVAAGNLMPMGELQTWKENREDARAFYDVTNDMNSVPNTEIRRRVETLRPTPGQVGFARQERVFKEAANVADGHIRLRNTDPAASVSDMPQVRQATADLANDPESGEALARLIAARLAAQDQIGIPEDRRSPITKTEAEVLAAPLRDPFIVGHERAVMRELGTLVQEQYGVHADKVFEAVLRANRVRGEMAVQAGHVAKKIGMGQPITLQDARAVDQASEVDAAERAVPPQPPAPAPARQGRRDVNPGRAAARELRANAPPGDKWEPARQKEAEVIPQRAIRSLLDDPSKAADFDVKYGQGKAKQILDKYRKPGGNG